MKNNYHRRLVAEREWAFNLINKGYDTKQKLSEGIEEGRNFEIDKLIKHFNYVSFERLIEKAKDFKGQEIKYGMVGNSESFKEVTSMMSKILDKDCVVLITGETGTGKNMIAEGIHFHGNRCKKPFVELPVTSYIKNCDILYADLSGTRKGAYTGAENRDGKIKMADGGTLFTNQVNSLPLDAQDGLLGFFDGNGVNMFGTAAPLDVDVRHIVSANEDLEVLTNKGKFRRDLYHRLNTVEIKVPPLKERKEDIPLLVKYFLRMYNEKYIKKGHGPFEISDSDIDKLADYPWPGNVRELKSVIEKGVIFGKIETPKYNIEIPTGDFQISPDDFSELGISLTKFIEETEKSLIENTVRQTNNLTDAAKLLKIPKRSLRYMINKYEIEK